MKTKNRAEEMKMKMNLCYLLPACISGFIEIKTECCFLEILSYFWF